jgi:archaellum component FlaG (FlaF/FlaG flagellin family)
MQSLLFSDKIREEIKLPIFPYIDKNDVTGDVRDADVEFVPFEWRSDISIIVNPEERPIYYDAATDKYMQYNHNDGWSEVSQSRLDEVVSTKAYIDNPNHMSYVFLNPRDIFFGINLSYEF